MYDLVQHDCRGLMVVGMGGDEVAGGGELDVGGAAGYYVLAALEAGENLIALSVGGSEGDFLLFVAGLVKLDVYEEMSLRLSDGLDREGRPSRRRGAIPVRRLRGVCPQCR